MAKTNKIMAKTNKIMENSTMFKAWEPATASAPTKSFGTLASIANAMPGSITKVNDSGKSLVVRRPDGTSALIVISSPLQKELAEGLAVSALGGCEVHEIVVDQNGVAYETPILRLQRPAGSTGIVITEFSDYVVAKGTTNRTRMAVPQSAALAV